MLHAEVNGRAIDELIVDPRTYADENLYNAVFAQLRRDAPIYWTEPAGFRPFWTVSRHADICAIELKPAEFLSGPRLILASQEYEEGYKAFMQGLDRLTHNLGSMDGQEHRVFRSMTQAWFGPKQIQQRAEQIRALARSAVDTMVERGGECDFVADIALWYPLRVIMSILGAPPEDEDYLMTFTREMFGSSDPETQRSAGAAGRIEPVREFTRYCNTVIADRRANPRDDVATVIANATVDGRPLTEHEAMSYLLLICTAGHDTTSSSAAAGLQQLILHPDQMKQLRENPDLLPRAVDEFIRWASPIRHFFRTSAIDTEIHGQQIRAGDALMMCYPSANRDEEVFDDPLSFRVDRAPARHIAFGYGPHLCLGQHLAKLEIRILFEEMLARLDDFEIIGETQMLQSTFAGGLKTLPIRYTVKAG